MNFSNDVRRGREGRGCPNSDIVSDFTGFSSEIGTKLRGWAVGQAGGSCCSQAALSSNDSKTLYFAFTLYGDKSKRGSYVTYLPSAHDI